MASIMNKPHAVCFPYPAQGHINPMLNLAKLLYHKGFYITFVHTEFNKQRLLNSRGSNSLDGLPDFQFETIPDGLPPSSEVDSNRDTFALCKSVSENCFIPFRNLLAKINSNRESNNCPPISCVIGDGIMSFTVDAAQEIGVPSFLFWTSSACGFLGYAYCKFLAQRGLVPLKDESYLTNGYMDMTIDWIPGMEGIRLKDLPTVIRTTDPNDFFFNFSIKETEGTYKASGIILNTYDELEHEVLVTLSAMYPPIYTIGPLHSLADQIPKENEISSIGSNLWTDDLECIKWLDSKEPNSVLYVNFGSMAVLAKEQLIEFAYGLANSKQNFLWIIRNDLVKGESAILPEEFIEETKDRGLVTNWFPQEKFLKHPSIGGYLSHMGWNSTIESLSSGKAMICWPSGGEQQTNCWFACNKWGVGIEIHSEVKKMEEIERINIIQADYVRSTEVENVVRAVMEREKGKEMRNKAMEWKRKAEVATESNGKSALDFDKLINEVLISQKKY